MASWDDLVKQANNYVANYNPNEQVNTQDSRLTTIENQRGQDITNTTNQYNQMINDTDKFYQTQIDTAKQIADRQAQVQNASTEQQIKEINQQRERTERDYQKEQRGAYTDYQKQVNEYGVNAEVMAARGLANTGYSESSQVSMYNAYQQRVATARQSLADSQQNYDNLIAQARINNDTRQAEIANELARQQAEYALQGFQYKNTLIESRQQQLNQLNARYDSRYNTMLGVMENELQAKRQNFNTYANVIQSNKELEQRQAQFDAEMKQKQAQWEKEYQLEKQRLELQRKQASSSSSSSRSVSNGTSRGVSGGTTSNGLVYKVAEKVEPITNPVTGGTVYKANYIY